MTSPGVGVRVLVVEDEALVAEDLRETLDAMGHRVVAVTDRGDHALLLAEELRPDLVLLDIRIRGALDGVQVAERIVGSLDIPTVFVTANADLATLDRATRAQPYGFVLKPFNERELRAAVGVALYRHRAERRLRQMESWLSTTLQSIGDAVIATDRDGRVSFMNVTAEFLTGWTRTEALGRALHEVFDVHSPSGETDVAAMVEQVLRDGVVFYLTRDFYLRTRGGHLVPIDDSIAPIRAEAKPIDGVVVIFRDRSEAQREASAREEMEQRLRDSQRMESLGLLAGGVAHDFNNILAAIAGHASLERELAVDGTELAESLDVITDAARRGAELCTQLLTYAGRSRTMLQPMELRAFVGASVRLLRVSIPKSIELVPELGDDTRGVMVDPGQLQQVVMNLVLNAADALKGAAGRITLRTGFARLDADALRRARVGADLAPGDFVFLEVADDGPGIAPAVLQRIFEPFFSTRGTGRGLGLSAVLGIVRAHQGALMVHTAPGEGATFRLCLPATAEPVRSLPAPAEHGDFRGAGRVLLADDEPAVRRMAQRILERMGFEVHTAADGAEALELFRAAPGSFCALVSDITMPRCNGVDAALAMRALRPTLPVVLMSGYTSEATLSLSGGSAPYARIQKPFAVEALRGALQRVLAG